MRAPSGGSWVSGALVRTVIQCAASHFLGGSLKGANVPPACNKIVSPQEAFCRAASTSLLPETLITFPGEGVEERAVLMHRVGRAAGPSFSAPNSGTSPLPQ